MTDAERKRAIKADLIYLPKDLKERCSNCTFFKKGYCAHPEVRLDIPDPELECCGYWNNPRVDRKITQGRK